MRDPRTRLVRRSWLLPVLLASAGVEAAGPCGPPPPPPPFLVFAPAVVGAGSPNRVASTADVGGAVYTWWITNGTITSGNGTREITFTAGAAGVNLHLSVSLTLDGCAFGGGFADVTVVPAWQAVQLYAVAPCRLIDTRGPDGPLGGPALEAAGHTDRSFPLAGSCGIPAGATSVAANVTVLPATAGGSLVAYPGDGSLPGTNTISFDPGHPRGNNAVLLLATDGSGTVRVNNSAADAVHLVVDMSGYFQ